MPSQCNRRKARWLPRWFHGGRKAAAFSGRGASVRGLRLGLEALEPREMLSAAPPDLKDVVWAVEPASASPSVAAQAALSDDYGNTCDAATQVKVYTSTSVTKSGSIEQVDDVDMFRFVAPVNGWVTVTEKARSGSHVDPHFYAYGADQQSLVDDDNGGGGLASRFDIPVTDGATYYVAATGNGDTTGKYKLSFRATRDDRGNTFSTAAALTLSSHGSGSKTADIEKPGDVDMFRVVARVTGVMTITQSAHYSRVDPFLSVYDGAGQPLGEDDNGGGGTKSRVAIQVQAGSTYFVAASAAGGTTGDYTLKCATAPGSSDDFGDTFDNATPVALADGGSGKQSGTIEKASDADMFQFVAPVSGRMTIAEAIQTGSKLDSFVTVYDASRHSIASDDDSAGGQDSMVTIRATAGSIYYVKAGAYGSSAGGYSLQFFTDPNPGSTYHIDLVVVGMTVAQEAVFRQAAERWEQVIVGDVPDVSYGGGVFDDLLIRASATPIDGSGGILGQAGPTGIRPGSSLPYRGIMEFDSADLGTMETGGYLLPVIMHEMGHVIGFGTIWGNLGLLAGAGTNNPRFTGPLATAEYNAVFGASESGVPVENTGGAGTRNSHWRESVFDNELMTGWINRGRPNLLSRVTVASIADLGYQVNMDAADPYSPSIALAAGGSQEDRPSSAGVFFLGFSPSSLSPWTSDSDRQRFAGRLCDAAFGSAPQTMFWSGEGLRI